MTVEIDWYIEGRVIETHITGQLTLEDVLGIRQQLIEYFVPHGKPPTIHTLLDMTQMEEATFTIKEWLNTPNQVTFTPEQRQLLDGWRLYYGKDDTAFRFLLNIFHQKEGHRVKWHPTREDALRFLAERDDTLGETIYTMEGFS